MIETNIQKDFIIGSEWLYYKIYCGDKTADDILLHIIKPFSEYLIEQKFVDKWFFIRYSDPESHLRVRFHLIDIEKINKIIFRFNVHLTPLINNRTVWKVQTDTYKRELNRYGKSTIKEIESLFFYDSSISIHALEGTNSNQERFLSAMEIVNNWLGLFKYSPSQKLTFVEQMRELFTNEFNASKITKKQLNKFYDVTFKEYETSCFLENQLNHSMKAIEIIVNSILIKYENGIIHVPMSDLLASVIHMSINRIFNSKQRLYEFVIYYFLSKFYRTNLEKRICVG